MGLFFTFLLIVFSSDISSTDFSKSAVNLFGVVTLGKGVIVGERTRNSFDGEYIFGAH